LLARLNGDGRFNDLVKNGWPLNFATQTAILGDFNYPTIDYIIIELNEGPDSDASYKSHSLID